MKDIRHFIWDFDGTLFDTYPVIIRSMGKEATPFGSIADGVAEVIRRGEDTLAFGSLYMAGHARDEFLKQSK